MLMVSFPISNQRSKHFILLLNISFGIFISRCWTVVGLCAVLYLAMLCSPFSGVRLSIQSMQRNNFVVRQCLYSPETLFLWPIQVYHFAFRATRPLQTYHTHTLGAPHMMPRAIFFIDVWKMCCLNIPLGAKNYQHFAIRQSIYIDLLEYFL